jgi:hypothetical protein
VQRVVERADLRPQAVQFGRQLRRVHVVGRTPHRAEVGKAKLGRALVGQLHLAHVEVFHRWRHAVPTVPHVQQCSRIARGRHNVLEFVQRQASAFRAAVLALAVHPVEPGPDFRLLRRFGQVGRRRHHDAAAQHVELAARVDVEADDIPEASRLGGNLDLRGGEVLRRAAASSSVSVMKFANTQPCAH